MKFLKIKNMLIEKELNYEVWITKLYNRIGMLFANDIIHANSCTYNVYASQFYHFYWFMILDLT